MRRREFVSFIIGAGVVWPFAARAQPANVPVIGLLNSLSSTSETAANNLSGLRKGLEDEGYVEGQNVTVMYRWAEGAYDRLPGLAADLVNHHVAVILATGNVAARAAKASTRTIPIVFTTGDDPVGTGLVSNLRRPGGNMTGVTTFAGALPVKRLEVLHELVPSAKTILMLINGRNANAERDAEAIKAAAKTLGLDVVIVQAANQSELDRELANMGGCGAEALLVNTDAFFTDRRAQIVAAAAHNNLPAMYSNREFSEAGGLISYGAEGSFPVLYRYAGLYVARILKGESPGELPVMQQAKFDLMINLKTARGLGLKVPTTLLARADEVIE